MPRAALVLALVSLTVALSGCIDRRPPSTPVQPEVEPGLAQAAPPHESGGEEASDVRRRLSRSSAGVPAAGGAF